MNFERERCGFEGVFDGLKMFMWMVGICFVISGIVGVRKMMFVVMKERSREIGMGKGVGGSGKWIVVLMVRECVMISVMWGMMGLI